MKRICFILLLAASAALADSTIILHWVETDIVTDDETSMTTTNCRVSFSLVDKFGAPFRTAVSLPVGYTSQDLSNSVSSGAAQLATSARVTDWTPQQVVLP